MKILKKYLILLLLVLFIWGCVSTASKTTAQSEQTDNTVLKEEKAPITTTSFENSTGYESKSSPGITVNKGNSEVLDLLPLDNTSAVTLSESDPIVESGVVVIDMDAPLHDPEKVIEDVVVISLIQRGEPEIEPEGMTEDIHPDDIPSIFDTPADKRGTVDSGFSIWDDSSKATPSGSAPSNFNKDWGSTNQEYRDPVYNDSGYSSDLVYNDNPYDDNSYNDNSYNENPYDDNPYNDNSYNDDPYRDDFKYDEEPISFDTYPEDVAVNEPDDEDYPEEAEEEEEEEENPVVEKWPPAKPTPKPTPKAPIGKPGSGGKMWTEPRSKTMKVGEKLRVKYLVDTGNNKLAAYGINIGFDPKVINVDVAIGNNGAEKGKDGYISAVNAKTPGSIRLSGFDVSGKGPKPNLELFSINYIAVGKGRTEIFIHIDTLTSDSYANIGPSRNVTGTAIVVY